MHTRSQHFRHHANTTAGDTANTAARMESTGVPNKIQASKKTADLLIQAGKESWVTRRAELVDAKGKGRMEHHLEN